MIEKIGFSKAILNLHIAHLIGYYFFFSHFIYTNIILANVKVNVMFSSFKQINCEIAFRVSQQPNIWIF